MESGSAGNVTAGNADDQWQNITGHRTAHVKSKPRRRRRPVQMRVLFRKPLPKDRKQDSSPMMVADFVFRKQIDWLVENTGVRDDFKDVAQKIWFSYLSHYMPDLKDGVEKELGGNPYWHLAFRHGDLKALLNCSGRELSGALRNLRGTRNGNTDVKKKSRLSQDFSHMKTRTIRSNMKVFRPTPVLLIALISLALHICQEEILISDLLRWARLLKFPLVDLTPYKDTASLAELHGITKMSVSLYGTVQYYNVEKINVWMACTLLDGHIGKLSPLPVAPFVERFIEELNLPSEMIPFVLGLLDRINSTAYCIETISIRRPPKFTRAKNMESHLMCVIFYALRILFVLDDSTENRISDATERLQEIAPSSKIFNFKVWYRHLMQRRMLLFKHTMLSRKSHSAPAYCDHIQSNQIPRSLISARKYVHRDAPVKDRRWKEHYTELQTSWRKSDAAFASQSSSFLIDLPVTARPYRAHTEVLSEHYPTLGVDFSQHTIKHLLDDKSWTKDNTNSEVQEALMTIQEARRFGYKHTQPFRVVRNRGTNSRNSVEKENRSRITQDLVRTMAEMIEHQSAQLFGYLLFLEIVFFPKHPHCSNVGNGKNLKRLKI